MGIPDHNLFKSTLATRGLSVDSFSAGVLRLSYDALKDAELKKGRGAISDLIDFATQAVNAQLDGNTPPLYPSLKSISVS